VEELKQVLGNGQSPSTSSMSSSSKVESKSAEVPEKRTCTEQPNEDENSGQPLVYKDSSTFLKVRF